MEKKYLTLISIFIISFLFTTNSYAIILENMPTSTDSVQPIPESITSNISNNFDINTYNLIRQNKINNTPENIYINQEENINLNPEIINNQNININKKTETKPIIFYFIIFIILSIIYFISRKIKTKNI